MEFCFGKKRKEKGNGVFFSSKLTMNNNNTYEEKSRYIRISDMRVRVREREISHTRQRNLSFFI